MLKKVIDTYKCKIIIHEKAEEYERWFCGDGCIMCAWELFIILVTSEPIDNSGH